MGRTWCRLACRKGKGRIAALQKAITFSRAFPVRLQLLNLLEKIVDGYHASPGRGLPIGSLTSQHLANFYLGYFDRFVKEKLRLRGYVRYMDDCILWGESASDLRFLVPQREAFVRSELVLDLKEPTICPARSGFEFLGCRVFPTHVTLNRRSRSDSEVASWTWSGPTCLASSANKCCNREPPLCLPSRLPAARRVGSFARA